MVCPLVCVVHGPRFLSPIFHSDVSESVTAAFPVHPNLTGTDKIISVYHRYLFDNWENADFYKLEPYLCKAPHIRLNNISFYASNDSLVQINF